MQPVIRFAADTGVAPPGAEPAEEGAGGATDTPREERAKPEPGPCPTPSKGYRLVDAAYERRSVAVSSNLHPSAFDELMLKSLATATVDWLMHHAHVCQTSGDSIRLTQAIAGKG